MRSYHFYFLSYPSSYLRGPNNDENQIELRKVLKQHVKVIETAQKWLSTPGYALTGLMCTVLFLRYLQMLFPSRFDVQYYAYSSWMVSIGDLPYRDIFFIKTPLMFFINAVPMLVFGSSIYVILLTEFLIVCASVLLVYFVTRQISGEYWLSLGAAFLFALFVNKYVFSYGGGRIENYELLFYLIGLYVLVKSDWQSPRLSTLYLFGLAIGCAALVRQSALISVLAWGIFWAVNPQITVSKLRTTTIYFSGIITVFTIFIAYLSVTGTLSHFIDIQFNYNPAYAMGGYIGKGWLLGNIILLKNMIKALYPIIPFFFLGLYRLDKQWSPILVLLLATLMEAFAFGNTGFIHYGIVSIPAITIVAAIGAAKLYSWVDSSADASRSKVMIVFLGLLIILPSGIIRTKHISFAWERISSEMKGNKSFMAENYELYKIADDLKSRLNNEEVFAFWGYQMIIPMLAQRRILPGLTPFQYFVVDLPSELVTKKRNEFVSLVRKHLPKIVVITTNHKKETAMPPESLMELLREHYILFKTYGPSNKSVAGFRGFNERSFQMWELTASSEKEVIDHVYNK